MDTRVRDVLHRTFRILGSPFKPRLATRKPQSYAAVLDPQTKASQSSLPEKKPMDSPDEIAIDSPTFDGSIRGQQAAASVVEAPESSDEQIHEIAKDQIAHSPHPESCHEDNEPQFTAGPSRVIAVHDGAKDCLALLLTEQMVTEFSLILEEARGLEDAENSYRRAKHIATMAEIDLREDKAKYKAADTQTERSNINKQIDQQTSALNESIAHRNNLEQDVSIRKGNLKYTQNLFHSTFKRAFQEANILKESVPKPAGNPQGLEGVDEVMLDSGASSEIHVDDSPEQQARQAALDRIERTGRTLQIMQDGFDSREVDYRNELEVYEEAVFRGTTKVTRTVFEQYAVRTLQQRTRALIDAEAAHEQALAHGRDLGVIGNDYEQESNFVSDPSDGYRESHDAIATATVDYDLIEAWTDQIVDAPDPNCDDMEDVDDWDAKTVGMSDSVSVVDFTRNRKRIDRWQELCRM